MNTLHADTIAAIATPAGRGGVGIVRLSGPRAHAIAAAVARIAPDTLHIREARHVRFHDAQQRVIDDGLLLVFRAPASFTGEDVAELQGHGGPVVMDLLLAACLERGARLARPGEFSERAFLNNKLDLAQAEAIADLIDAGSAAAVRGAVRSLTGDFSRQVHAVVEALVELRVYVEAAIDFPEEEVDFLADGQVLGMLDGIERQLAQLAAGAKSGSLLREGITVVIAGKPNAGKSSLLNALAGREAAIVTDIAGTTRDVLREHLAIDGIPLHVIDTAGLRASSDPVEQEGIRRAWAAIREADLVLLLVDGTGTPTGDVQALWPEFVAALAPGQALLTVRNKCDLSGESPGDAAHAAVAISAKTGAGIDALRARVLAMAGAGEVQAEGAYTARRRHLDAIARARTAVADGRAQLESARAGELLAEDLRQAQAALGEITGEFSADDLLGRIFSSFCIGK
jgi:tRNA modification GTPase